ncbi:hypothetical protein JA1_000380 [Spathaspora sp. JA1]|nr:hypothetical protein JA1_000380 [Spathaspora sp. JA1]
MCSQSTNLSNLGRPGTAIQRVLDKVVSNVLPILSSTTTTTTSTLNDQKDSSSSNQKARASMTSHKLYKKIGRLIRQKNKAKNIEQDLTNDLLAWSNNIPNFDNQQLIREFSQLILLQSRTTAEIIENLEKTKLSLSFVHEREKKRNELINTKFKLEKQLKEVQAKFGPKAASSILISERLEETESALQTVQSQYDACIATDLRDTIAVFTYSLQSVSQKLSEAAHHFGNSLSQDSAEMKMSPNKYSRSNHKLSTEAQDRYGGFSTPESLENVSQQNEGQSSQQQQQQQSQSQQQRNITQQSIQNQRQFSKQNMSNRQSLESEPHTQPHQYPNHENVVESCFTREVSESDKHWQ